MLPIRIPDVLILVKFDTGSRVVFQNTNTWPCPLIICIRGCGLVCYLAFAKFAEHSITKETLYLVSISFSRYIKVMMPG